MHTSFTARARRVLSDARRTASERAGAEVLLPDLLLGLVPAGGPAGRVLGELGVTSAAVRRRLPAAAPDPAGGGAGDPSAGPASGPPGDPRNASPNGLPSDPSADPASGPPGDPEGPTLSPQVLRVLARARADVPPAQPVDAHHLLLALVDVDDPGVRRLLTSAGVPPRVLRDRVLAAANDDRPPAPSPRVFISYRRQQARHVAGRIADWLADRAEVFLDVHSIRPGADFTEAINTAVDGCTALVAVIGPGWAGLTDDRGRQRLAQADDVVRLEVEAALRRDVAVIPVLVDGARMPRVDELPESLRPLAFRNALEIRHESFRQDVARLGEAVTRG
ncbi:toll/interleukin-1 receptor domain-containing protein [Saccharothrix xinjiangensis]|uniref:TIR domain-containing protein n=1 Tax=Saccharothrix xinjiangensis TaxID=204798 RepID=A0ABV9XZL5_9PSEU